MRKRHSAPSTDGGNGLRMRYHLQTMALKRVLSKACDKCGKSNSYVRTYRIVAFHEGRTLTVHLCPEHRVQLTEFLDMFPKGKRSIPRLRSIDSKEEAMRGMHKEMGS